jgi:hypothetical protein
MNSATPRSSKRRWIWIFLVNHKVPRLAFDFGIALAVGIPATGVSVILDVAKAPDLLYLHRRQVRMLSSTRRPSRHRALTDPYRSGQT